MDKYNDFTNISHLCLELQRVLTGLDELNFQIKLVCYDQNFGDYNILESNFDNSRELLYWSTIQLSRSLGYLEFIRDLEEFELYRKYLT